jgi:RimJ/RimL family protein N-acetyltransferase
MEIRPLLEEDVEPLIDVCAAALWGPLEEPDRPRQRKRIGHLLETDPGGAWVAEHAGEPVGVALALIREGVWGLSLFALAEEHRGSGHGGALLDAAVAYGTGCRGGIILSSEHPGAMRLYARAGFALQPCVAFGGMVTNRPALPSAVRDGDGADHSWMDEIARTVRGAGYGTDIGRQLADGARLRCVEDRGWTLARGSRISTLCATDEAAARALLTAHLAEAREAVEVLFLTAGQDWAIEVGLEAGLVLSPDGPVFTRGELGPLRPWIPSGAYL